MFRDCDNNAHCIVWRSGRALMMKKKIVGLGVATIQHAF